MAAEKIIKAAQVAIGVLKDKKKRRVLLASLAIILFLIVMIPVVIGVSAVTALATVVSGICSFLGSGVAPEQLRVEQMIEAFDSGYTLSRDQEISLRMTSDDFRYMLVRINEYNHAGERERTVTIEGRYAYGDDEYDEEDDMEDDGEYGEDDGTGPYYDDDLSGSSEENEGYDDRTSGPGALTGTETEGDEPPDGGTDAPDGEDDAGTAGVGTYGQRGRSKYRKETPTREITLRNDYIEGISEYDYRIFYTYLAMAASDRETSDKVLSGVVSLDSDFRTISTGEDRSQSSDALVKSGYMITRVDIDRMFTYTSMDYGAYYFDGVRDTKETYTYEECESLPHVTEETDIAGETVIWCIPYSYIRGGQSSYSVLEAVKNEDETVLVAMKESFSHDRMTDTMKSLSRYAESVGMDNYLKQLPGGEELMEKLDTWKDTGMVLAYIETPPIEIKASFDIVSYHAGGLFWSGGYSSIGEAAVAWCYERSCQGHTADGLLANNTDCWRYNQDERDKEGFADCSSMVYRAYQAAGLIWPDSYIMTTSSFKALFDEHPEMVLATEKDNEKILDSTIQLMPGDVILMTPMNGADWAESDNHIVMYAGDGMIIHATSTGSLSDIGGHICAATTLTSYYNARLSTSRHLIYARPYTGLECSIDYSSRGKLVSRQTGGGLTAKEISSIMSSLPYPENEEAFGEIALFYAVNDAKTSGILPSLTAAQAILETGFCTSEICLALNNFFGMKAGLSEGTWTSSSWGGESKLMQTWEVENGRNVTIDAAFRYYSSIDESFADHSEYLTAARKEDGSLRYEGLRSAGSYADAAAILVKGGYATDPSYADKLGDVIKRLRLDKYDKTYATADVGIPECLSGYVYRQQSAAGSKVSAADGEKITWDKVSGEEFAEFSVIHTGWATMYVPENQNGYTVCVNAGHGTSGGDSQKTYSHPDKTPKVTGGTTAAGAVQSTAVSSGMTFSDGTSEYSVTLKCAKYLRDELIGRGYSVLMIRDDSLTEATQLDNIARTVMANTYADIHVAIHWDGDGLSYDKGCFYMSVPDTGGYRQMYPVSEHWQQHHELGNSLVSALKSSGFSSWNGGSLEQDLTQTSYSKIPSVDIELGNQSSAHDDATVGKQATALADGIEAYFKAHPSQKAVQQTSASGTGTGAASAETNPERFNLPSSARLLVAVSGESRTSSNDTVYVYYKEDGTWKLQFQTRGVHGTNGMSNNRTAGDRTTPIGAWRLNTPFGQQPAKAGFPSDYKQVNSTSVWSDTTNKLILNGNGQSGEKVGTSSYEILYDYCLDSGYNMAGMKGKGSALFLHCTTEGKTSTAGCVAIDTERMIDVMKLYAKAGTGNSYIAQAPAGKFSLIYNAFGLNLSPEGDF